MDLIDRQEAIKALEKAGEVNYIATGDFHGIINALNVIKGLPNANPTLTQHSPKWISCGERLPEASERMPYKRGEVSSEWVLVSMVDCGRPDDEVVKIGRYSYEPRLWPDDGKARGWVVANGQYGKVTAWMELPPVYKEDTND